VDGFFGFAAVAIIFYVSLIVICLFNRMQNYNLKWNFRPVS
jgi:hypothetical protein